MATVREVRVVDAPASPDEYTTKESALTAEPHRFVVDRVFPTREKAKAAAYRVNNGERERWPRSRYFAIFAANPDPEAEPDENGVVQDAWHLLIGVRPHIPEGWAKEVSAPGSRRKSESEGQREQLTPEEDDDEEAADLEPVAA